MRQLKRLCLSLLALVLLSGCSGNTTVIKNPTPSPLTTVTPQPTAEVSASQDNESFNEFLDNSFKDALSNDFTTLHAYYIDPANAGINLSAVDVNLGIGFTMEEQQWIKDHNQKEYDQFNTFDRTTLSPIQQDLYDMYKFQMDLDIALSDPKFDYYGQLFSSLSGLHYNLTSFFSDYRLDDANDVDDLITLVVDTTRYVDSALEYTTIQAEKGLLMSDMDDVLNYINSVLDSSDESAVLESMITNIRELGLTNEDEYIERLTNAFYDHFIPAYQHMYDTLSGLKDLNQEGGYAQFEYGKEYYELLLKQATGTNADIDTIKSEMENAIINEMLSMYSVINENGDDPYLNDFINTMGTPSLDFDSYQSILEYAKDHMDDVVPTINDLQYEIYDINTAMASTSGVMAYFNIPPIDGQTIQQMRVNPLSSDLTTLDTYMTICHEGFPGHMYQYAYMYENIDSLWQKFMANNLAYTEGYATYAQFKALDFLNELSTPLKDVYIRNELIVYYVIILADIGIHYDGMDIDDFEAFMDEYGLTMDRNGLQAQYKQLQANPCAFEPYYYGYYRIDALQDDAMATLSDGYDQVAFTQFILDNANLSFDIIQSNYDQWLNQQ